MTNCKEVTDGNREDNQRVEHPFPDLAVDSAESLSKDDESGERSGAFRHNREIGSDGSRGTFVDVGSPEVERHHRDFEADTCDDESQSHEEKRGAFGSDI